MIALLNRSRVPRRVRAACSLKCTVTAVKRYETMRSACALIRPLAVVVRRSELELEHAHLCDVCVGAVERAIRLRVRRRSEDDCEERKCCAETNRFHRLFHRSRSQQGRAREQDVRWVHANSSERSAVHTSFHGVSPNVRSSARCLWHFAAASLSNKDSRCDCRRRLMRRR
jgi:hypothetical protein